MESLWRFDQEVFRAIHIGLHRDWLDPVFWVITSTGLGWVQALLILLTPLVIDLRHEMRRRSFFQAVLACWKNPVFAVWPMLLTVGVSGIFFAQGVKRFIAERDRPSLLDYAVPQEGFTRNSFPSGHTTTAFAIAFMIFFLTWKTEKAWVGRYALGWALLVGISRVYRGVHWPTDVMGGIFAGLLSSSLVYVLIVARTKVEEGPPITEAANPPSA